MYSHTYVVSNEDFVQYQYLVLSCIQYVEVVHQHHPVHSRTPRLNNKLNKINIVFASSVSL